MPETHTPAYLSPTKLAQLPKLSSFQASHYVQIKCDMCRIRHLYEPADLIQVFGDLPFFGIEQQFRCSRCGKKEYLTSKLRPVSGPEAVGITVRRLVRIKTLRRPVWKDVQR
ncbi:putative nucleic-acid-binding Zn-ribbon protein [Rhizobium leucaenae]|nr:putative nucleic-acid-binding Zn-ribbon protein [Rhizobium leucaenae]